MFEDGYHVSGRFTPTPNEDGGRRETSDTENYNVSGKIGWDVSNNHRIQAGGFFLKGDWGVPPNVYAANPRYWKWNLWEDVNGHVGHAGRYGAYAVWDAFLRVRPVKNLSLWLNAENLLDADYQNAYGFPEPGRTFWFGIRGHVG
jgi:outer membrane receptor protein involved in Fe transport